MSSWFYLRSFEVLFLEPKTTLLQFKLTIMSFFNILWLYECDDR